MNTYLLKLTILFILSISTTFANTESSLDCALKKINFKNGNVILNTNSKSQVYFIKNKSSSTIMLNHIKKNAGAGAGWLSSLATNHWSAIAVSQKNFALQCRITSENKAELIDCASSLQICQPTSGLTVKSDGNYWITEDKSFHELLNALHQRGIK